MGVMAEATLHQEGTSMGKSIPGRGSRKCEGPLGGVTLDEFRDDEGPLGLQKSQSAGEGGSVILAGSRGRSPEGS